MGWLFLNGISKKDLIRELQQRSTQEDGNIKREVLSSCVRGNVLWSVVEVTNKEKSTTHRFIGCDLLRSDSEGWGYKDMDESVHPFYYSCPLKYLEMAPVVDCEEWRVKVREYHARRNRKMVIGQRLSLVNSSVPYVEITSTKPLCGIFNGRQYRVPKKFIGEIVQQQGT